MDRDSVRSYVEKGGSTGEKQGREKRQYRRFNVSFKVHIMLSSGEIVTGLAKNISKGGIYIEYGTSADAGTELELKFSVLLNETPETVYVRARVVRSIAIAGRDAFGIAFVYLNFHKNSETVLDQLLLKYQKQYPELSY